MPATEIASLLESFQNRAAGTDAERRAARALADELSSDGHEVLVETFWCRPNWPLANAWHVALAIAGSLVSVASPVAGIAMLAVALASLATDAMAGISLGRRLTPERASQNVTFVPRAAARGQRDTTAADTNVRLIITANYDAGRAGLVDRDAFRGAAAAFRRALRGLTPGWMGWLLIAVLWLLAIAALRLEGDKSHTIGAIQLAPTVALVLGFALLLELATADWSPGAGDNGTGVAVALMLGRELEAAPPRHLDVEVVLTGAGDQDQTGLRRYLRNRRRERRRTNTVVLGIASCAGGRPSWWSSDGALLPLRYARPLRQLAKQIAADEGHLDVKAHPGRGNGTAFPARLARLPAITIGALDDRGLAPRSHQRGDVASSIGKQALERTVQFSLLLIDGIDATVAEAGARPSPTPA